MKISWSATTRATYFTTLWSGPSHGRHFDTTGEATFDVLPTSLRILNKYAASRGRPVVICSPQGAMIISVFSLKQ